MPMFHDFKALYELFKSHNIPEAKTLLMKMQARYIVMCDENILLRKQLQDHITQKSLVNDLNLSHVGYWFISSGLKQGPFCKTCYENNKLLVLLDAESLYWHCPNCQNVIARSKVVNAPDITPPTTHPISHEKKLTPCDVISFSKKNL